MYKIALTALVLAPLFGGVALAQSAHVGHNVDTAVGPEAYPPSALQAWGQQRNGVSAQDPQNFGAHPSPLGNPQQGTPSQND